MIGPPSSVSDFNNVWFYLERNKSNQSIYKLGKKKILKNDILILEFNSMGLVSSKKLLRLQDMNDIKIAEKVTKKKFRTDNKIYDMLTTVRDKLNASRKKK